MVLDLTQLDTLPSHLDLLCVLATKEYKTAIFGVPDQISCPVYPPARTKELKRRKCCGSLLYIVKITAAENWPFEQELSHRAYRNQTVQRVDDPSHTADWPANIGGVRQRIHLLPDSACYRALCGAVAGPHMQTASPFGDKRLTHRFRMHRDEG